MGAAKFRRSAGPSATSETQDHSFQTNDSKPMRQLLKNTFTLAVALVFTAGLAFGQSNESIVNQVGSSIDATVTQTGQSNYSELDQSEDWIDGHSATITQIGENNYSNIQTQNGGGTANVFMKGDGNTLEDWSTRSRGGFGANQKNSLNVFDLDIDGDQNTVGMTQEFATGTVEINGSGNEVGLRQLSGANYQTQDFHTATVRIGLYGGTSSDNKVDVNQASNGGSSVGGTGGKNNSASVKILTGELNDIDVRQGGSDNKQSIEVTGSSNTYTAEQFGDGNALYLNSRGTGPGPDAPGAFTEDNSFTMTQDGTDNLVDAGIDGDDNTVDITQSGSNNFVDGSTTGLFDADGVGIAGDNNTVTIMQSGAGHMSTNTVVGSGNVVDVTQSN
jgi:hypothetical protein